MENPLIKFRISPTSRTILFAFSLFIGNLFIAATAHAQGTATLAGRVADEQRATLAGATVQATNTAIGTTRTATTNDTGLYVFAELPAGTYRLRVERGGFQAATRDDVILNVAGRATEDFTLTIGSLQETINVEAAGSIIERDPATVDTVVDRAFVETSGLHRRRSAPLQFAVKLLF